MGSQETAYTQRPIMENGEATFEYNWTWYSQYAAGTYGIRVDFTNNAYYFTGNSTTLATTGAYINVTVVGTTHGSGNGSSTFNIPDLRDRFIVAAGKFATFEEFLNLTVSLVDRP